MLRHTQSLNRKSKISNILETLPSLAVPCLYLNVMVGDLLAYSPAMLVSYPGHWIVCIL